MNARTPSLSYLQVCKSGYEILKYPDRKLVVLDLNGTLVWRSERGQAARPPKLRRDLTQFTQYLFQNFDVMIWSSSTPKSITKMCDVIFTTEQQAQLVAIWGRDTMGLTPSEYRSKVQTYKNLETIWHDEKLGKVGQFSQYNTIIIDDSTEKVKQHPYNLIALPEYNSALHHSGQDTGLSETVDYLKGLQMCSNVSAYLLEHPVEFGHKMKKKKSANVLGRA